MEKGDLEWLKNWNSKKKRLPAHRQSPREMMLVRVRLHLRGANV
jgi:hypothetical protein